MAKKEQLYPCVVIRPGVHMGKVELKVGKTISLTETQIQARVGKVRLKADMEKEAGLTDSSRQELETAVTESENALGDAVEKIQALQEQVDEAAAVHTRNGELQEAVDALTSANEALRSELGALKGGK